MFVSSAFLYLRCTDSGTVIRLGHAITCKKPRLDWPAVTSVCVDVLDSIRWYKSAFLVLIDCVSYMNKSNSELSVFLYHKIVQERQERSPEFCYLSL